MVDLSKLDINCDVPMPSCKEPKVEMTLRDYFAAKALQGMLAASNRQASDEHMFARDAYTVADAMLRERAK